MKMRIFDEIIIGSLKEDAPNGDITTEYTVPEGTVVSGEFISKGDGVICGLGIISRTFELIGGNVEVNLYFKDGDEVKKGDVIAAIKGDAKTILIGERTVLNLIQRASGIATMTKNASDQVKGYKAKITDTRKTMPLLRVLDKYAVRVGGGYNHRFSLSDGVLIKDNHIKAAGSVTDAVIRAKAKVPHTIKVEVEAENLDMLREAMSAGADIVMLDNMTNGEMKKAAEIAAGRVLLEASGNMGDKNLVDVAKTGVDIISIGALTHSVKVLDISLKLR
ncbi:MAG: carboxylating nicotinate-nucleotide diphosphorylase [Clostridiales bacterium]|jgi:nicotinate-nucleotide pyrophosphorylase (carboxylating)|nr:carboxylating nicotinate-nucleotide diphosphorylase [Clostridiales bacterium]